MAERKQGVPVRYWWLAGVFILLAAVAGVVWPRALANTAPPFWEERNRPASPLTVPPGAKVAVFANGCFWGLEETFRAIPGVLDTRAGFTGGTTRNPTYETVHTDKTGHVEAVEVAYDPATVRYETLVEAFFQHHDPTLGGGKGVPGIAHPYRSFLFTSDADQERAARAVIVNLTRTGNYVHAPRPIQTRIEPRGPFYLADEYHQHYYAKRGGSAACRM